MILDRLGLWPARAVWLLAPLAVGVGLAEGLAPKPETPALIVEILLWLAWFTVLVATLTPSPRSLTICRIAGPTALGLSILTPVAGRWTGATILGVGFASLFCAVIFLPTFGDRMINGSAYGSERRMSLRPTAPALLGPIQVAWVLVFAGLVTGPLLLLSRRYVAAAVAAAVGAGAIWAGGRVLHQLARRWIVFVPAGFVIHDPLLLVDSVLLRRNQVAALGPARVLDDGTADDVDGNDGLPAPTPSDRRMDLSGGALGLALEVALKAPTPVTVKQRGRIETLKLSNIVFCPTLPGAMLSEARIRGVKIGEASPTT